MTRQGFLSQVWAIARPYWGSRDSARGWVLLATVVGLALGLVWMAVQFNDWNRDFYNTFEAKDQAEFFRQLGRFTLLAVLFIVMSVYRFYFQQMLQIEWRTWLTERYLERWLREGTHYRMQLLARATDNPDQRIAEDLRIFIDLTLSLALGLLSAVVTLVSFVGILWGLSGSLEVAGYSVPGYMVWIAIVYAIAGSFLSHWIGRPLVGLEFERQRYEADFRYALVRLRENSEGVALYRGEKDEYAGLRGRFTSVIGNWWALMKKQKQLGWFTSFYGQVAIIFPYVVVSPRYFAGVIPLGGIFQTASAFGQVQGALSWFIDAYTQFASWKATVDRLSGFAEAVRATAEGDVAQRGTRSEADTKAIEVDGFALATPDGRNLLAASELRIAAGERVLIRGPSGAGKSTLFRTLAGIWPWWRGRLTLPRGSRRLFLPQRPYLPIGSLRRAACYPDTERGHGDEAIREALVRVGLPQLAGDLDREDHWAQRLSGGEQQRLALARALIIRPDWLFLDEATSSLPEDAEDGMYRLLVEALPDSTIVSIGHRERLAAHHQRQLVWGEPGADGARLMPA